VLLLSWKFCGQSPENSHYTGTATMTSQKVYA
jgi:hypothetical protein